MLSIQIVWWCYTVSGGPTAPPPKCKNAVLRAAMAQLPGILAAIPINEEEKYGFKNRNEFKRAALGIPYQEFSLHQNIATGYWRLPVVVDAQNRILMKMKLENGKWVFAGFSGSRLARELGFHEKHFSRGKPAWGRIVRDFQLNCEYIQLEPVSEVSLAGKLYPLESAARMILRSRCTIDSKGYTLQEIQDIRSRVLKPQRTEL